MISHNPKASAESYWSIVNSFINNIKIPNIPPLKVNDVLISGFTVNSKLFNSYFAA